MGSAELTLVRIDVSGDHFKRRSRSADVKSALAVLRITFARFNSARPSTVREAWFVEFGTMKVSFLCCEESRL